MNKFNTIFLITLLTLSGAQTIHASEDDHDHKTAHTEEGHDTHDEDGDAHEEGHDAHEKDGDTHEEEEGIHLKAAQQKAAGITTTTLKLTNIGSSISAPGEITLNAYATSQAASLISAQVVKRHAKLGDSVSLGQPLVTLSSVEMAQAQGDLLVAAREWNRVRKLGQKVVSAARYIQAKVNNEQARAKVQAYGMNQQQVEVMLKAGNNRLANGRFQLLALQGGTVIQDQFTLGEVVNAGQMLFKISDETKLWVNTRLTAKQVTDVQIGATANISFGEKTLTGTVIQRHHSLDESTRTIGVRIEVANPNDVLHPGVFVDVSITATNTENVLSVPADAVLRSPDGDWMVFVEHEDNQFEPQEIEVLRTNNGVTVIDGIDAGSRVVTHGAFFLQSELAKSGFNIHNH
ncbi:MAG: efflux RND transporter periplasmic adaptor subunit [Cycloclasticus pugetii]|jgi:RND family efflux transporter MFP subunit|uniref:efflux RND transporter periplasmic adaptor subunit n=1 Tax=Cycloclasticus pugetii TaxID=34068 RepID=UPI003A8E1A87